MGVSEVEGLEPVAEALAGIEDGVVVRIGADVGAVDDLCGELSQVHDSSGADRGPGHAGPVERGDQVGRGPRPAGEACRSDGTPLVALTVTRHQQLSTTEFMAMVPDTPVVLEDEHFDLTDDEYAEVVKAVLADEIGRDEGSNFVVKRAFQARVATSHRLSPWPSTPASSTRKPAPIGPSSSTPATAR